MKLIWLIVFFVNLFVFETCAQLGREQTIFTRRDSLRGMLSPNRTCYDVYYYHLDVVVDPAAKSIAGRNTIFFEVVEDTDVIQVDLFENMYIFRISVNDGKKLKFSRVHNAIFIKFPRELPKGSRQRIDIDYGGNPQIARRPPWDGGFIWTLDSAGNPWVAVTCQGTGASLWWPNKDHPSDEPDSMLISVTVPEGLENISNGRLMGSSKAGDGRTKFNWFVSYPINNYNVTVNIGKFYHFDDLYVDEKGDTLTLDYYVLPEDLGNAKQQFAQVKPMMDFFHKYFGPYPFQRDGYKLIQSPHLGMEHQTAVAYGNQYLNGYRGTGTSEVGITFDFIILHETAHEWWGNSITARDAADMWIHESFGAYSEGLFVEHRYGYEESMKYINGKKQNVKNDRPIVGPYGVNKEGSVDMYDKGQLILNTLRHVINNDRLWFDMLKEMNELFRYRSIDGKQVFNFFKRRTEMDLDYFFHQYFLQKDLPTLLVNVMKKGDNVIASYKWIADVDDFRMPIRITTEPRKFELVYPTGQEQTIELKGLHPDDFRIAEDQFFVNLKVLKTYIDPRK